MDTGVSTSFLTAELATAVEQAVKTAVQAVMCELTKAVGATLDNLRMEVAEKERENQSLRLRLDISDSKLKAVRECLNLGGDSSGLPQTSQSDSTRTEKQTHSAGQDKTAGPPAQRQVTARPVRPSSDSVLPVLCSTQQEPPAQHSKVDSTWKQTGSVFEEKEVYPDASTEPRVEDTPDAEHIHLAKDTSEMESVLIKEEDSDLESVHVIEDVLQMESVIIKDEVSHMNSVPHVEVAFQQETVTIMEDAPQSISSNNDNHSTVLGSIPSSTKCGKCEKSFGKEAEQAPQAPYLCTQCAIEFGDLKNQTRQKHQTTVKRKSYYCCECGHSFNQLTCLRKHQQIHAGKSPYTCTECEKSFSQLVYLNQHQRVHTGETPFCCIECGRSFSQLGNLMQHLRIHTGEKPFRCTDCGKSFRHIDGLKKHRRIHTGEKPYQCTECGQDFRHLNSFKRHWRTHTENSL
uniref:Zinc finger and SCAN domain-containing protein 2-like n=1 Tax=Erpetoichthys calabaricus TaxID=27687 RepID=A0A8C4SBP3_ERPCA